MSAPSQRSLLASAFLVAFGAITVARVRAYSRSSKAMIRLRRSFTIARPFEMVTARLKDFEGLELIQSNGSEGRLQLGKIIATIQFKRAPANRGTEIFAEVRYPGLTPRVISKFIDFALRSKVRRFKQQIEVGEIVGSRSEQVLLMHA